MIKDPFILTINTKNLLKNYNFFNKRKKNLIVAPTIKANSYGLGDVRVFKFLLKNKCKHFFVATLDEGIRINNKNKNIKIYVLNGIQNYDLKIFKKYNLIPIINTIYELNKIINSDIKFGLHIDTGINRLGVKYNEIPNKIYKNKNIKIILTHLSSADERKNKYNFLQKNIFLKEIKKFENKKIIYSICNSNGAILSKSFLLDMIRPGIGLYGGNNQNIKLAKKLKPVIFLKAKIIQIKTINLNEYVGYNQTFKTNKRTTIAIIGAGYADGIPRKLSNKGKVFFKKDKFNIIGRVSMDSFTIDISKTKYNLKVGQYIDIINKKHGVEEFALQCETISNEVITLIGGRVKRLYV